MPSHSEEFLRLANEAKARIKEVSPQEAAKLVSEGAILVDVREKEEFDKSHLPDAQHVSRGLLEMKIHEVAPDKTAPVVCYCAGGNRGALAADTLQKMGYSNVVSIQGGLNACSIEEEKA
ncbi:sulfurtransferase [Verrucomicrobia bacterium LW23]|nr:sulfurtransferase [Verrucomicrobia bacterium LW23]